MATMVSYLGGIPEFKKPCEVTIKIVSDRVRVSAGIFSKAEIPFETITNVSMKTDEQISKDVTIDTASEIDKFKALLDSGAITQNEYDAKKKQFLDELNDENKKREVSI